MRLTPLIAALRAIQDRLCPVVRIVSTFLLPRATNLTILTAPMPSRRPCHSRARVRDSDDRYGISMVPFDEPGEFRVLMDAVIAGCPVAAERLCRDYQKHVLRVVRRRLMRRQRVQFDSLDIVQDVWASFFTRLPVGRRFDNPNAFIVYLCRMAANKVGEAARRRRRMKNDARREEPLPDSFDCLLVSPMPTPSKIVVAEDQWQHMLDGRPLAHRRILTLLRQGMTHAEIAARLGTNLKTIQRLLRRVQLARES